MSYVKNYDVGQIKLDLPYANYIHELPLLSFGDVKHTINLSLVYNSERKAAGDNSFHIANGFKLNMQKRIVKTNGGAPTHFEEANGKLVELTYTCGVYTFDDTTQRILRSTSSGFEIEYPDFSKEEYNTNGYITSVCDKYGETFLNYVYGENNRLTSIVYRSTKTITLNYESNKLASIAYGGKTIGFGYDAVGITINHYSGVTHTLLTSETNYISTCAGAETDPDTNETVNVSYTKNLVVNTIDSIVITDSMLYSQAGETKYSILDIATYKFLGYNETNKSAMVEVTDKQGVTTRMQFENDKLTYSYEVTAELSNDFDKYYGTVAAYNNNDIVGYQSYADGDKMTDINNNGIAHSFEMQDATSGTFVLSGWINAYDIDECTISITDAAHSTNEFAVERSIPIAKSDTWQYFACSFNASNPIILLVSANPSTPTVYLRDLRLTIQEGIIPDSKKVNHLKLTREVLIQESSTGNDAKYFVLNDGSFQFYNGSTIIGGTVTMRDMLQYKINQMYGTHKNIIFYDDYKKAVTSAGDLCVKYTEDGTIHTVTVKNLAVGRVSYANGKKYVTKTNFYLDEDNNYRLITKSSINGVCYKEEVYNGNLDVISSTVEDATVRYAYDPNDLIVKETTAPKSVSEDALEDTTRSDVMVKQYTYNETTGETTVIDEFGNSTVYEIDDTWGVVNKVTLPDGTVIADNYDDDKCALMSREFSNATSPRNTTFSYLGGNLTGVTHTNTTDSIAYTFTHDKDKLVNIQKGANTIEEHEHTDTTLDSYYPTKANKLHSVLSDFDKYGRLNITDGIVENVYDVAPEYDSNGDLIVKSANGSALLATSKDLTNNQTSKYEYNDQNQLIKKQIKNSAGTVVKEETFDYDAIGRITTDTCVYDKANSKSIRTEILYEKAVDDPLADNKPNRYSHYLNNSFSPIAQTGYDFDDFNRIKTKFCSINGSEFTKNITYTKTRPTRLFEMLSGRPLNTTDYTYDSMGRIATVTADGSTTQYTYDAYGQLVQEKDVSLDKTIQYVYNGIGNIKSITTTTSSGTTSTQSFTYGDTANPDRLTKFGSKAITYNTMGCPLSYDGKNFTWSKGKLNSVSKGSPKVLTSPYESYSYTYNALGQRTAKNYTYRPINFSSTSTYLQNCYTYYDYDNAGRLIRERRTYSYSDSTSYSLEFIFLYDESGIVGVQFKDGTATPQAFYYQRNLQGDVVAIYNTAGVLQAKYRYDAYGNCTVTNSTNLHLATYNPIRYRGYYYDDETKWYFLNARYYSPEWRRFISPDDISYLDPKSANGLNLYCYCGNDPVNYADPSGCLAVELTTLFCIIFAAIGATVGGVVAYNTAKESGAEGWDLVGWTTLGIIGGGVIGAAIGYGAGALIAKATGVLGFSITKHSIITIKNITILGNMPLYIEIAKSTSSGYYLISNDLWNSLSDTERWLNNMQYIKDAFQLGSQFILTPEKVVKEGTTFWQEIQFLIENGIPWYMP